MRFASRNFWAAREPAPRVFYFCLYPWPGPVPFPLLLSSRFAHTQGKSSSLLSLIVPNLSWIHSSFRLLLLHALSLSSHGWLLVHSLFHFISFIFPGSCPFFIWITPSLYSIPPEYGHWVPRKVKGPWCHLCHFPRQAQLEASISRGTEIISYS